MNFNSYWLLHYNLRRNDDKVSLPSRRLSKWGTNTLRYQGAIIHNSLVDLGLHNITSKPVVTNKLKSIYQLSYVLHRFKLMVLSKQDLEALDHHHKVKLEGVLRLYPCTPLPVVYFLAGSLPASAVLHLRQLQRLGL